MDGVPVVTRSKAKGQSMGVQHGLSSHVIASPSKYRRTDDIDFNTVQVWSDLSCVPRFETLVAKPPLHSVVIRIHPEVADYLLKNTNPNNRPLSVRFGQYLAVDINANHYGVTGDTIKFSVTGKLLDGQHRLDGCRRSGTPITTHVVFGLPDAVFDIIDQGKKRSPSDVLALAGVSEHGVVAGAVRQVVLMSVATGTNTYAPEHYAYLTPRKIRELIEGPMRDMPDLAEDARLVHTAFKHSPTIILAILFLISRHSKALAKEFAHQWVHGARVGRNENFDVLSARLVSVNQKSGGHINRTVFAAMVVTMFNHWHANIIATPRALTWHRDFAFPALEFDGEAFVRTRQNRAGSELPVLVDRMLLAFDRYTDTSGTVVQTRAFLANKARVSIRSVPDILDRMEEDELVTCVRQHGSQGPAVWRLTTKGHERVTTLKA